MASAPRAIDTRIAAAARLSALVRLLLLALSLGVVSYYLGDQDEPELESIRQTLWITIASVAVCALGMAVLVRRIHARWQLQCLQLFDIAWISWLAYLTGGVASPAVPLLFAVVLASNAGLATMVPLLAPTAAGIGLATSAILYLVEITPLSIELLPAAQLEPTRIVGSLVIEAGALFLVDVLGQALSRRASEQLLVTGELLEQLGEGVVAVDLAGRVTYGNREAERLLNIPGALVAGRPWREVLSAERHAPVWALLDDAPLPDQRRWRTPDHRQLVLRGRWLQGRRGRLIGRTLTIADHTRLATLESDAARSERLASIGEMAAGIAHEVRNPLASLRGCAQELAELATGPDGSDADGLARIMVSEADRVSGLIEDFLGLARMRAPDLVPVDVVAVASDVVTMQRRDASNPTGLSLSVAAADGVPEVMADPAQISQALVNLVANAVQAVADVVDPSVTLRVRSEGSGVMLAVSDNGHGVPDDVRERVFTPFFSTKSRGTGLGLSLVQRIARSHHGRVELDSNATNGTEFRIWLPAAV